MRFGRSNVPCVAAPAYHYAMLFAGRKPRFPRPVRARDNDPPIGEMKRPTGLGGPCRYSAASGGLSATGLAFGLRARGLRFGFGASSGVSTKPLSGCGASGCTSGVG